VFKRDAVDRFEQLRAELRRRLGVLEAPLEEGWGMWMRLRDALAADEVVLLQGDRVMPGQQGQRVRFMDGHILLPAGPVKLAQASGAPLVPIFSVRQRRGKIRLFVEEPIIVPPDAPPGEGPHPALARLAAVLERYVRAYPHQWLMVRPVWCEDCGS
jgi:lauroyl/myristoyl acyltransferase